MKKHTSRTLLWASTVLSLAVPAVAEAQTTSSDEIFVTARRREENQQDVPLAVTALSAAQLERSGVTDVMSLQGTVPNLIIVPGQGAGTHTPVFAIRGLSQQDLTHLSDPSVSLYVNDMVIPRPMGGNIGFFDLANVQVARGPQGTLFGRNTTGGAVIVTPHAATDVLEGSISQTIAEHETYRTEAVLNLPLGDLAAIRVAGVHRESDGYILDTELSKNINTVDEDAMRVTLDVRPTARLSTQFAFNIAGADDGGTGTTSAPPAIANSPSGRYVTQSGHPQHNDVDIWSLDNHITYELNENVTIRNIIGYRELQSNQLEDTDGRSAIAGLIGRITSQNQMSEELQILGEESWGNWIAGAYYFREEGDDLGGSVGVNLGAPAPNPNVKTIDDIRGYDQYSATWSTAENTSYAVFAQTTLHLDSIDDGLSATVGVRQNWDERNAVILNRVVNDADPDGMACRYSRDLDNNTATPETAAALLTEAQCHLSLGATFSEPTYNLSLDWAATDDLLFYVATRHGYRTGGFGARANTEAGLRRTFIPETVNDIELGMKADWNIGSTFLRTNVALFYADYKDIQRLLTDNTTSPVTTVTTNAGQAEIQGIELEFLLRPVSWFELSGFWAYTDADFTEFLSPQTTPPTDISNAPFARAPRNINSATARFDLPLGESIGEGNFSVSYYHQDRYNSNDSFSPVTGWQEPYDLVDVVAGIDGLFGSNADVQVYANNAADNVYSTTVLSAGAGIHSRTPGEPRTYGVRLRYNFGGE